MTPFCVFQRIFKIFQNSKNQKPQTYCKSTFWSIAIIIQIILARKFVSFDIFWTPKIAAILEVQKTAKMRFYEQV